VQDDGAFVDVHDQGPGLTPKQQAVVWERFRRVDGTEQQSGSGAGLGLGLYICRTIIERHGGEVGLESTPGRGSTFWVRLPLARVSE
jgi:signal transduction histidine kinase